LKRFWTPGVVHSSSISGLTPGLNLVTATELSQTEKVNSVGFLTEILCAKFVVHLLVS